MAEHASEARVRQRSDSDVAPTTLVLAAVASVVATAVVSRFGLAGTLLGAALTPVVVTIVREFGRKPVVQVGAMTSAAGNWRHWRHQRAAAPSDIDEAPPPPRPVPPTPRRPSRVRWSVVGAASVVGFLAAVAFFTVPDLIAGQSLVADRDSTFFSSRDSAPKEPVTAPTTTGTTETTQNTTTAPTTTAPETETETVTVTTDAAPATTAPPPGEPVAPPATAPTPTPPPAPAPTS